MKLIIVRNITLQYKTTKEVFFHHSHLVEDYPNSLLTRTSSIFEFSIVPSTVKEGDNMAANIRLAYRDIQV